MRQMTFSNLVVRVLIVPTFALASLLLSGCSIPVVNPGSMDAVAPVSTAPRAGTVYLVRGWLGVFSTGIDALGDKVKAAGLHEEVYQEAQWRTLAETIARKYAGVRDPEPLVLVGHSFGADDIVAISRELEKFGIAIDLLVTIDPTTPPSVPANVRHVYNLYQSNSLDALPLFRGIPLKADPDFKGRLDNVNVRVERLDLGEGDVNHFNIEKKETIHRETLKQILAVCPPRPQWAGAPHRAAPPLPSITAAHAQGPTVVRTPPTARPTAAYLSNNN
jgi:hypothetical protein